MRLAGHGDAVLGVDISADGEPRRECRRRRQLPALGRVRRRRRDRSSTVAATAATDVAFSPDGRQILGVGDDGRSGSGTHATGASRSTSTARDGNCRRPRSARDGRRFATGGRDGVTRVWSVAGGPPLAVLRGQRSRVFDVGFGPSSDRVVSAGDDGTVRIWDAGTDAGLDRAEP